MEEMNINEFMEKYCQDILKDDNILSLLEEEDFSYDVIRKDPDTGKDIKYVVDEKGIEIPIYDILEMEEEDFKNYYRTPESFAMYKQYLSNFKITYGEDIILELRNNIQKQNERINRFRQIRDDINCGL